MSTLSIALPCEITYEWSPDLVKLGARRFILRQAGRRLVVFLCIMAVLVAALAFMGEASWWLLAIVAVFPPFLWLVYHFRVTRIRHEMSDRRVIVRVQPGSSAKGGCNLYHGCVTSFRTMMRSSNGAHASSFSKRMALVSPARSGTSTLTVPRTFSPWVSGK